MSQEEKLKVNELKRCFILSVGSVILKVQNRVSLSQRITAIGSER